MPHSADSSRSLQIRLNHLDQLFSSLRTLAVALARGVYDVHPHVVLDELGHQAVHRSARGYYQLKHIGTSFFSLQSALDGLDLAAHPSDSRQQFVFLFDSVAHRYTLPGMVYV